MIYLSGPALAQGREGEEWSSFSSSSVDAVTIAAATDVAPGAPAKNIFEEEATEETAGGNGLFDERRTEEVE